MTTLPENLRAKVEAERNLIMNRCLGYEPELNAYTPWNYVIAGAEALFQILVEGQKFPEVTLNREEFEILLKISAHYEAKLAERDAEIERLQSLINTGSVQKTEAPEYDYGQKFVSHCNKCVRRHKDDPHATARCISAYAAVKTRSTNEF